MPILLEFIVLMNQNYNDFIYIFHSTKEHSDLIKSYIKLKNKNCEVISDDKIKSHTLKISFCSCKVWHCFVRNLQI